MASKAVYFLAVPGFADWEAGHALAEVRRNSNYDIRVVGLTGKPVQSMGGVTVQPDLAIADVDRSDVALFILPGGERWEEQPVEPELVDLLESLDERGVPIAAICGATTAVARIGLLRGRRHTSNGLGYLQEQVPVYDESANYVDRLAVRDRRLITASGLGDVEFAREIMAELGILNEDDRTAWAKMFRSGKFPATAA